MDVKQISDTVSVGPQPSEDELDSLAEQGFKTIINLRTDQEEDQPLNPATEGELVRAKGLEYRNIPVSMDNMEPTLVDKFRNDLASLPSPTYVHCLSGKRAGAFVMMDEGVRNNMSGSDVLDQAEEMGFKCDQPELKQFVTEYVDSHNKLAGN